MSANAAVCAEPVYTSRQRRTQVDIHLDQLARARAFHLINFGQIVCKCLLLSNLQAVTECVHLQVHERTQFATNGHFVAAQSVTLCTFVADTNTENKALANLPNVAACVRMKDQRAREIK